MLALLVPVHSLRLAAFFGAIEIEIVPFHCGFTAVVLRKISNNLGDSLHRGDSVVVLFLFSNRDKPAKARYCICRGWIARLEET